MKGLDYSRTEEVVVTSGLFSYFCQIALKFLSVLWIWSLGCCFELICMLIYVIVWIICCVLYCLWGFSIWATDVSGSLWLVARAVWGFELLVWMFSACLAHGFPTEDSILNFVSLLTLLGWSALGWVRFCSGFDGS